MPSAAEIAARRTCRNRSGDGGGGSRRRRLGGNIDLENDYMKRGQLDGEGLRHFQHTQQQQAFINNMKAAVSVGSVWLPAICTSLFPQQIPDLR